MDFFTSIAGEWTGIGVGVYPPTVPEFKYSETLTISSTSKPNVWGIKSVTKELTTGKPMHVETGFVRVAATSTSMVMSHPFGLAEISVASNATPEMIQFESDSITRTPCAKTPYATQIKRTYTLQNADRMEFTMDMATSTHPELQNHLIATYTRKI